MKRLFKKLAILILPLAIIIISVNYFVDPANVFSEDKYVENIANIMASGNNVDNVTNYNERLCQKYFLQKQKNKSPDIIILGSSRIMEISTSIYPENKVLNVGVGGADINDLLSIIGIVDELNIKPKKIILNVEPYLICKEDKNSNNWWLPIKEFHQRFTAKYCKNGSLNYSIYDKDEKFKKLSTLVSFAYFKSAIEFLSKGNTKEVKNIGSAVPQHKGRYADGSIAYSYEYKNPDSIKTAVVAKLRGAKSPFVEIDNNRLQYLSCLLNYLKSNNIEVTLLMIPFHPSFYAEVNSKQNNIFNLYENVFNDIAKQQNVKIVGSFSPHNLNLFNVDFYDDIHCSINAFKKLLLK